MELPRFRYVPFVHEMASDWSAPLTVDRLVDLN